MALRSPYFRKHCPNIFPHVCKVTFVIIWTNYWNNLIREIKSKVNTLVVTFVVPVSSVWLWCVNSVSSVSLTVSTTSLVTAETSRPMHTHGQFSFSDKGSALTDLSVCLSHQLQWRAAGSGGGVPAGWRSPGTQHIERLQGRREAGRRSLPQGLSADLGSEGRRTPSPHQCTPPPRGERREHDI